MYLFLLIGLIIGFILNFIIYVYCKDKLILKNLFSLKALKNKKLVIIVSVLNMIIYLLIYYRFNLSLYSFICALIFSLLLCLSIIDLKIGIVPDSINILIFILSIPVILINREHIIYHIIGLFLISVPFFLIAVLTNGIGGGDIKLFAVTGLFLGALHIFLAMFFCCLLASIIGLTLKYTNKLNTKNNNSIPLVPYISIGVILSTLYGDYILNWYFSKFFY